MFEDFDLNGGIPRGELVRFEAGFTSMARMHGITMTPAARLILVLSVSSPASLAWAQDATKELEKKEQQKLQGTWNVVSMSAAGQEMPEATINGVKAVIVKNQMIMEQNNKKDPATFWLDVSKKPKWFDVTVKDLKMTGIYELEGDTLRICLAIQQGDRPMDFATKPDRPHMLMVLRRHKQ